MLSSSNIIENIQADLLDMRALKQHLDFDPFFEVQEKNNTMAGLFQQLNQLSAQFEAQNNSTTEFLTTNEQVISQLNKKLLYLESLISIFEKEASRPQKKI